MTDEQHDEVAHGRAKRSGSDGGDSIYLILGLAFIVIGISGLAFETVHWTFLPIGIVFLAVSATSSRKKRSDNQGSGADGGPAVAGRGSDHDVDGGDGSGGDGGGGGGD